MNCNAALDVLCASIVNLNILLPGMDESIFGKDLTKLDSYDVVVGGDGVNQAVVMSALGLNVGVAGKIGKDDFGIAALRALNRNGVNTSCVRETDSGKTAVCVVLINKDGEHVFVSHRGASEHFTVSDINDEVLRNTKIFNIGSLYSFPGMYGDALGELMARARAMGVITSADCMSDSYGLGGRSMDAVLRELDYFFPNFGEACYVTGKTAPEDIAEELHKRGVRNVAVKMGDKGAYVSDGREGLMIPAYYVTPVDTTGAGDSFLAGFLYGVLKGYDIAGCARLGGAAASICVGAVGATGHIKNAAQLERIIKEQNDNE